MCIVVAFPSAFYNTYPFYCFFFVLCYNKLNIILQRNQENNMSEKGLTNISLKKINKSKVYQYIYRKKKTSKQQIVQELQMGLSTVSQNLNLLEQEGLIEKKRLFASTGGRKANAIQIVSDFKISIGIGILISSHPGCVLLP